MLGLIIASAWRSHAQNCPDESSINISLPQSQSVSLLQTDMVGLRKTTATSLGSSSATSRKQKRYNATQGSGTWVMGSKLQSCSDACQAQGLVCKAEDFVARNYEIDTETEMAQIVAALNYQCVSFRSDITWWKDVPWYVPKTGVCAVSSPYRRAEQFGCNAKPRPKKANRLCWCSPNADDKNAEIQDIWTESPTGCPCYFNETQKDCACCNVGGCQCSAQHRNKCAPCGSMWQCVVAPTTIQSESALPHGLETLLNAAIEAKTYEAQQAGVWSFLREAYRLPTVQAKVQMVGLLSMRLAQASPFGATHAFEFPDSDDVEDWLTSIFLEEEILELSKNVTKTGTNSSSPPTVLGLVSRGAHVQKKLQSCDWHVALHEFYHTGGGYGNWCGKQVMINGIPHPFGGCASKQKARSHKTAGSRATKICKDTGLDKACLRHDQGGYAEDLWGVATKSLCKVDADFLNARKKVKTESSFADGLSRKEGKILQAANCLFSIMPCLRYETKVHWTWCPSKWGGFPCKQTSTGYFTYWPMNDFSNFTEDACGPTGCYQTVKKIQAKWGTFHSMQGPSHSQAPATNSKWGSWKSSRRSGRRYR